MLNLWSDTKIGGSFQSIVLTTESNIIIGYKSHALTHKSEYNLKHIDNTLNKPTGGSSPPIFPDNKKVNRIELHISGIMCGKLKKVCNHSHALLLLYSYPNRISIYIYKYTHFYALKFEKKFRKTSKEIAHNNAHCW